MNKHCVPADVTSCHAGRGSHRPQQERGDRRRDHKKAEQQYSSVWRPFQGRFGALFGFLALIFRLVVQVPAPATSDRAVVNLQNRCAIPTSLFPSTYALISVLSERMRHSSPHGYLTNHGLGMNHHFLLALTGYEVLPTIQQLRFSHRVLNHQTKSQFILQSSRCL